MTTPKTDELYIKYSRLVIEYFRYLEYGIPIAPIIVRKPIDINHINLKNDKTLDDYLASSKMDIAELAADFESAVNEAKRNMPVMCGLAMGIIK